ncbi:MAG TPA: hypothetical protein VII47_13095 [Actinomycetota bacterium]
MDEQVEMERGGTVQAAVQGGRVAAAFDPRLADVWLEVFACGAALSESVELVGCFLRMAYLRGYEDGLCEAQPGSLFTSLGLPVPPRQTGSGRVRKERRT